MEIRCRCGDACIKPNIAILEDLGSFYSPCTGCKAFNLKKFSPLSNQIDLNEIDTTFGSCNCGKRHLDVVIAHILKIMIDEGVKEENSRLKDACTPLITPAYPMHAIPYLPANSLVILSDKMNKKCAERIVDEIREVKGVLKGDLKETVGIKDVDFNPNVYELLSGCDVRCDVVQTPYGPLCIHKYQSKIHIEFPKAKSEKIEILRKTLDKYDNPSVLDCTCGPGTLGIACLKAGARRVIFNDLWFPATELTAINLEANGFPVELLDGKEGLIASGENFEVYCLDIRKLKEVLDDKFDICIIDAFPDVDTIEFVEAASRLGKEVVVI